MSIAGLIKIHQMAKHALSHSGQEQSLKSMGSMGLKIVVVRPFSKTLRLADHRQEYSERTKQLYNQNMFYDETIDTANGNLSAQIF